MKWNRILLRLFRCKCVYACVYMWVCDLFTMHSLYNFYYIIKFRFARFISAHTHKWNEINPYSSLADLYILDRHSNFSGSHWEKKLVVHIFFGLCYFFAPLNVVLFLPLFRNYENVRPFVCSFVRMFLSFDDRYEKKKSNIVFVIVM